MTQRRPSSSPRPIRILVVDDDETIRRGFTRWLPGNDVVTLGDARMALERIVLGEHFDVILSDVMMPAMTGMDFYAAVALLAPAHLARMIFMSGGGDSARACDFIERCPAPILHKPFTLGELRAFIRAQVERCR